MFLIPDTSAILVCSHTQKSNSLHYTYPRSTTNPHTTHAETVPQVAYDKVEWKAFLFRVIQFAVESDSLFHQKHSSLKRVRLASTQIENKGSLLELSQQLGLQHMQ